MKNYYLEKDLSRFQPPPAWKPDGVKILERLIEQTTDFVVDIERSERFIPSVMDEGTIVEQCIEGCYDEEKAKYWIFMHLYQHAVCQANAIGILIEKSFYRGVLQLWRTLFEAYVLCEWFAEHHRENPRLFQDYISHSLLRSWIRYMDNHNKLCKKKGRDAKYDESEIKVMKSMFKNRFRSYRDYSWAEPTLGETPRFRDLMDDVNAEEKVLYRLSSQEIHPTLGSRFVLRDISLPLQPVPMPFTGATSTLDYATARTLTQMTSRVSDFLVLNKSLQERLESLIALSNDVLDKLKKWSATEGV